MDDSQLEEFYDMVLRGIDKQVAVEFLGVPWEPVQEQLNLGKSDALSDLDTEDSRFYLKVKQLEATWEIKWYEEKVLEAAAKAADVTKAFEPLARKKPARYASPGTAKVYDAESGGKGPAAALLKKMADDRTDQDE